MKLIHSIIISLIFIIADKMAFTQESSEKKWIMMDPSKELPSNCHVGGYEDSTSYKGLLYIGRKNVEEELAIGKIFIEKKTGYFPKHGVAHVSDTYEIFCGGYVGWIDKNKRQEHLVAGGHTGDGDPFYVCRGVIRGQVFPGKFLKEYGCCYVPVGNKEECATDYSLMATCCNLGN